MKCRIVISAALLLVTSSFGFGPAARATDARDLLFQNETPGSDQKSTKPASPKPLPKSEQLEPLKSGSPDDRVNYALLLEQHKNYAAMIETLKPVNDRLGRKGLLLLAKAYRKTGDNMSELRTLELCMATHPKDYFVKTALGDLYSRMNRSEDAIAAYSEARAMNPKYEPAFLGLLAEFDKEKSSFEALNLVNDMIKNFGRRGDLLSILCRLYSGDAYLGKAVEICNEAIRSQPNNPLNYMYLGVCLRDQEEPEKATAFLIKAAKRFPKSGPLQAVLAAISYDQKDYPKAYEGYKRAVKAEPNSGANYVGLANAAFELQKLDEALSAYIKACQLDKLLSRDFRTADGKLRARKDGKWQSKYEDGLLKCP